MENKDILKNVEKLVEMYKNGLLGGEKMPEDSNPNLSKESIENYNYFTLPMALNYQRNSYKLWESANQTWDDTETNFIFDTKKVSSSSFEQVQKALIKYKVALQQNKQTEIWIKLCNTINELFDGDIRKLFENSDYDINKIKNYIQKENKSKFPYLSGNKICNYWLYVLYQYTDIEFKNIQELTVAPDTHVVKASCKLGVITEQELNSSNVQLIVTDRWNKLLKETKYNPIDLHTPMWLWSRNGFINLILRSKKMKKVAIFGSTGSIGESTLNIIRENPKLFEVVTLVAGKNIGKLLEQIEEFKPKNVYIIDEENAEKIKKIHKDINVFYGEQGMEEISQLTDFDISISALVGVAGLKPTYNMIKNGKAVALANKEVLVAGGELIMKTAKENNSQLLTVDSEHSAIMQCLNGEESNKIDKILLTASGGPFFDKEITDKITVEEALNHPTWSMGPKVTIDSSTMMNKGFEIIEAKWLFDVEPNQVEVVVHRKSLVHSMVQFEDGTIMANIGPKSMQIPIAYALNYPNRLSNNIEKLDLFDVVDLKFEKPDLNKFKCLRLAYEAIEKGHSYQVVLNATNEVLVELFLNKKIKYTDIPNGIEKMMSMYEKRELNTIDKILEFDKEVKENTRKIFDKN